jgi:hypothetical protein
MRISLRQKQMHRQGRCGEDECSFKRIRTTYCPSHSCSIRRSSFSDSLSYSQVNDYVGMMAALLLDGCDHMVRIRRAGPRHALMVEMGTRVRQDATYREA